MDKTLGKFLGDSPKNKSEHLNSNHIFAEYFKEIGVQSNYFIDNLRPFNPNNIKMSQIDQSCHNDCWFLATLGSMAQTREGRYQIANMIQKGNDGAYYVTFPGIANKTIRITQQDIVNDNLTNKAAWANIIEAAAIKLYPKQTQNGGLPSEAIKLLTNKSAEYKLIHDDHEYFGITSANAERYIKDSLKDGQPLIACTGKTTTHGLVASHAYSVVGYKDGYVYVRNPWGVNHRGNSKLPIPGQTIDGVTNIGRGELKMPLAVFMKKFDYIYKEDSNFEYPLELYTDYLNPCVNYLKPMVNKISQEVAQELQKLKYDYDNSTFKWGI